MDNKDTVLTLQTPEGIEFVLHPAGLPIRACSWAIDTLIQGAIIFGILILNVVLGRVLGIWFFLILIFALDWFYHSLFEVFNRGQSPGKRIMGVMVVCGDGSPISPGASFLRNLLRFADTFLFCYLIAFICMLASPAFRRLGDWVADTIVVYTAGARSTVRRSAMPRLSEFPVVYPNRKLKFEEKQTILMFARRYPLLGRARSNEIANIWPIADLSAGNSAFEPSALLLGIAHTLDGTQ
ncbi:MAG: RDD family protein [Treponema sp.]|nr:RDD family protein [Treponema sp.]